MIRNKRHALIIVGTSYKLAPAGGKSLMKEAGITGKHIQIQNVIAPNIISKKNGIIGKNKFHEAIEIDSIVFDNLETKGVKLDDWLDDIDFHFNNKYKTQYINILEW